MRRTTTTLMLTFIGGLAAFGPSWPAAAQSTGYVTGFPGRDPAGDDEIGWGPAYRPETSFSQPGTPPTPGDFADRAYRARTGRGPYDAIQDTRGMRPIGYPQGLREDAPRRRSIGMRRAAKPEARASRRRSAVMQGQR